MSSKKDKTRGKISIPSSLDRTATSIIAATIESVDRVGPCSAKMSLGSIQDIRESKKTDIIQRAKEILKKWTIEETTSSDEIVKEVSESIRTAEIIEYGPEELPAGPDVESETSIIIVEGRADVLNLLKAGIKNSIAVEGAKIPDSIIKLTKKKEVTTFLDGDRGGTLILKELLQVAEIDFTARAPRGREVEELSPKEIFKSLRAKKPVEEQPKQPDKKVREEKKKRKPLPKKKPATTLEISEKVIESIDELKGTLEAIVLDEKMKEIARIPVSEIAEKLKDMNKTHTVIFDGVITQRLVDIASQKKVNTIIADRVSNVAKQPADLRILSFKDVVEKKE
jgi:DNA primase